MANMNYLNFSLYQIQLFLVVCECESFTTASQIFHTTQSSVSKSIASMESALGFPLFIRSKNRLTLTEPGKLLAKEWRSVVRNMELSINKAFLLFEREQRSIIVGEPDSMKTDRDYWPAIDKFQNERKDISLVFVERPIAELITKLVSNELDIIFTIDYEIPTLDKLGLCWKAVADSPNLQITVHEDNPLSQKERITVEDLRDEDFIVPAPTLHQSYIDLLFDLCRPYGFKPKISVTVPNFRSVITTMLRTHSGILMANRFIYDADSAKVKNFQLDNTYSRLIVAWKNNPMKPGVTDFVRAVTENYKSII